MHRLPIKLCYFSNCVKTFANHSKVCAVVVCVGHESYAIICSKKLKLFYSLVHSQQWGHFKTMRTKNVLINIFGKFKRKMDQVWSISLLD